MSIFVWILGAACVVLIFGTFIACAAVLVAGFCEEIARAIYQHRAKPAEQRQALATNIAGLERKLGLDDGSPGLPLPRPGGDLSGD